MGPKPSEVAADKQAEARIKAAFCRFGMLAYTSEYVAEIQEEAAKRYAEARVAYCRVYDKHDLRTMYIYGYVSSMLGWPIYFANGRLASDGLSSEQQQRLASMYDEWDLRRDAARDWEAWFT